LWPGVFIGAWLVNLWAGAPVLVAFGIAVGNTLEAVVGAHVLRRWGGFRGSFDSLRHVLCLILGAAVLSTLVSASFGVASLWLSGVVRSGRQALETCRAWWIGDVLGDLVVAPLLLTWTRRAEPAVMPRARMAEAAGLTVLLCAGAVVIFFRPVAPVVSVVSPYMLFPLFVWSALRFELKGATLATALVSALATWGTVRGSGPFVREALANGLLGLQVSMAWAAIASLIVAGVAMDRSRAIRAQEAFMATVSHDLKTPLNALLMSGESLFRRPTEEALRRHRHVLMRSIDRMLRMITDLVDASAIERGRFAVEPKAEDASTLVDEALDLLRPLASSKDLSLCSDHAEAIQIQCDRGRLLQVLSNIVGNAIKFCPERGRITLNVDRLQEAVRFSVRDTGPGISSALALQVIRGRRFGPWPFHRQGHGGSAWGSDVGGEQVRYGLHVLLHDPHRE
jgi:signal transduction histidine kinase